MKKNQATFVKNILPEALPWYVARRLPPHELISQWQQLMGPYLAERARPVCLEKDGLLVLAVRGSALRQELNLSSVQVVDKLQQAGFAVERLKLITARQASDPLPEPPPLPPLSSAEEEEITRQVAQVQSPLVRQALKRMLSEGRRAWKGHNS